MHLTRLVQDAGPVFGEGDPSGPTVWLALGLVATSTIAGAWLARHRAKHLVAWLAIASATMLVVTLTDLIPDAWRDAVETGVPLWAVGISVAAGFMAIAYLTREDYGLEAASDERPPGVHAPGRHRRLKEAAGAAFFGGMGTAAALTTHRAIEGATLALSTSAVIVIALMVHSASEGLALAALLDMAERRIVPWLVIACVSPVIGVIFEMITPLPGRLVPVLLGMVAGVLLRTAVAGLRLAVHKREDERPLARHLAVAAVVAVSVAALLAMAHEVQRRMGREQNTRFIETFGHGARPPRHLLGPHSMDLSTPARPESGPERHQRAATQQPSVPDLPETQPPTTGLPDPLSPVPGSAIRRSPITESPVARSRPSSPSPPRSPAGATRTPGARTLGSRSPGSVAPRASVGQTGGEILAAVRSGRATLAEVLERKDAAARRLQLGRLLNALPGCDRAETATLMARGRIDRNRRVGGLDDRQRQRLLKVFARCHP